MVKQDKEGLIVDDSTLKELKSKTTKAVKKQKTKKYIVREKTKAFIAQRDFGQLEVGDEVVLNANEYNVLKNFLQE